MDSATSKILDTREIEFAINEKHDKIKNLEIGIDAVTQTIIATRKEIDELRVKYITDYQLLGGIWEIELGTPFEESYLYGWYYDDGCNGKWTKKSHHLYDFLDGEDLRIPYGSYDHSHAEIRFEDHGHMELHFHYLTAKEVFQFFKEYFISVNVEKIEDLLQSRMSDVESFMILRTKLQGDF